MKILLKSIVPGVKLVVAATPARQALGTIVRHPVGEWILYDQTEDRDVLRSERGLRTIVKLTRQYYATREESS